MVFGNVGSQGLESIGAYPAGGCPGTVGLVVGGGACRAGAEVYVGAGIEVWVATGAACAESGPWFGAVVRVGRGFRYVEGGWCATPCLNPANGTIALLPESDNNSSATRRYGRAFGRPLPPAAGTRSPSAPWALLADWFSVYARKASASEYPSRFGFAVRMVVGWAGQRDEEFCSIRLRFFGKLGETFPIVVANSPSFLGILEFTPPTKGILEVHSRLPPLSRDLGSLHRFLGLWPPGQGDIPLSSRASRPALGCGWAWGEGGGGGRPMEDYIYSCGRRLTWF